MPLSPLQILKLALEAGFRGQDAITATAIALAESGGNPAAYNPELGAGTRPGSGSRGLWQIYGQAHPEFNSDLVLDPRANAAAAYKVYREVGGKFTPWSTYKGGQYKQYLASVPKSIGGGAPIQSSGGGALSGAVGSSGGVQGGGFQLPALELKLPEVRWLDLGFIIGGMILVIVGLVILGLVLVREPATQVAKLGATVAISKVL